MGHNNISLLYSLFAPYLYRTWYLGIIMMVYHKVFQNVLCKYGRNLFCTTKPNLFSFIKLSLYQYIYLIYMCVYINIYIKYTFLLSCFLHLSILLLVWQLYLNHTFPILILLLSLHLFHTDIQRSNIKLLKCKMFHPRLCRV